MKTKKILIRSAQVIVILLIFYFLVKGVIANWDQVKGFDWKFDYPLLILSFVLQMAALFWLVQIWRWILRHTGSTVSYSGLFKVWFFANLGRYLPGKVWQFLGMVYMLEKRGVPPRNTFSTVVLAQTCSVMSGLLIAFAFLGVNLYSQFLSGNPGLIVVIAIFFLAVIALVSYPNLLRKVVNFGLGVLKREKISLDISSKDVIIYILCYSVSWLLFGLAFLVFIKAMAVASFAMYPSLTGAFAFSVNIGFLVLFVPGGIGVREGLLVLLLSTLFPAFFPVPVATLISLLARLWVTVAELLCFSIAVPLK
ncbi:MAG: hypothetical protein AMJ91_04810 [candidate division Zixibacteria bacterium SM23_73_3]|nr:MAG: hypothetical protein AMJ91_04810 [candidate division Zixibacteria bacterium SM23_73_3]